MSTRQPPVQQPPPEQKLRLRYAKRGPARFTSHRDFGRALERALRRADIPMAYSSGFTPHPRISYASPSPTSASSEAEYVELGLTEVCDPVKVVAALNEVLPQGFEMLDAAEAVKESLGELLQVSDWEIRLDAAPGVLQAAVAELLGREHLTVERMTKRGMRAFDVRAAIVSLDVLDDRTLLLRSLIETPLVRPDDVVAALRTIDESIPQEMLLNRLSQGPLVDGGTGDPLRPA
ncbi:TIGR03936 family radical SAM-associated protein [Tessaracoccus lubricantis]|uniref:TIGR03936 family radical SAM-associated protein n=1 Tax=Tessaracoccus lubricantis TaxID=545543 RepID=A0ABP9F345_9ACTN